MLTGIRFSAIIALLGCLSHLSAQPSSGSLEGQVTDPSGAAVSGAAIEVTAADGLLRTSTTDLQGYYRLNNLAPGVYSLRVTTAGFAPFEKTGITVTAGAAQTLLVRLEIQQSKQNITIAGGASQVGVDPSQNASQIVLRGSDLDAFSDDPEDLANELQMLAGPSPGPDGAQIFIDGFSAGIMPPKASIREIRVNQNPFSSEYDRVGFGRIDVITKPGSEKYHGQASFDFANRALTARNPFLASPIVPNYRQEQFAGNFGGPFIEESEFLCRRQPAHYGREFAADLYISRFRFQSLSGQWRDRGAFAADQRQSALRLRPDVE
jgi:Carboxypeptidase regulatory-like domain